jgi:multidrug resistance efflux pump
MPATINDVVRAAKALDEAKFALEQLRNKKNNCQSEIDNINLQLPAAKAAVAAAKTDLTTVVADFDPT